jgi:hypothetical protein
VNPDQGQPEAPTLGQIIDGLGCTANLEEGDLVADAVILLKVIEPDGTVRLSTCWSENISWIERSGMLRTAERQDLEGAYSHEED